MAARRIVGGIIVALLSLVAMALFIVTLYIPHINGRIQQVSPSVILEPYGADLEFYLTRGTATNDYGEEIWSEDPYGSDIGSALVFGRCPDALDDLRLVRRLIVACTILCGASAALALISMFFCGRMARWGSFPMFFSFLTSLAAVGLMVWVAVLFFTVYDDHRDCLSSFGADGNFSEFGNFSDFTFARSRAARNRRFRSADDIDTFIYSDSNKTGTGQFYYLRSNNNVEYFESILAPQYQQLYSNLTSDQQFQFRRAVAVGAVGDIRVNDVRLAQGPRVLIAAWGVALISVVLAIIFLCVFCCCPRSSRSVQKKHINKNRSPSEMVTHTVITTTDFPPQLYTAPNPNSSIDHDFNNPNTAAPTHFQVPAAQAENPRSPMYVDVHNAAFPAGSSSAEPIEQPYTYDVNRQRRMPEERVLRGNPHTNTLTYSKQQATLQPNQNPRRPMPLHIVPSSSNVSAHEQSAVSNHPTLLNITRHPSKRDASMTPAPIGYLSISSPTGH